METLGQYLKREREQRGISLEDIAKHTKYHITKVRALEDDRHADLPSPPYVKGMLRSISHFLEIDVTDVMLRYQDYLNESRTAVEQREIGLPKLAFYKRRHFLTIAATTAFFVLAIVVFILFQESKKLEPIGELKIIEQPSDKTDEKTEYETVVKFKYQLRMLASDNVWIKSQIDSERPTNFYLHKGGSYNFEAKKRIRFFVSEASSIQLIFNGQEVRILKAGPRTFRFPIIKSR